jgi:hypothetical protein
VKTFRDRQTDRPTDRHTERECVKEREREKKKKKKKKKKKRVEYLSVWLSAPRLTIVFAGDNLAANGLVDNVPHIDLHVVAIIAKRPVDGCVLNLCRWLILALEIQRQQTSV